MEANKSDKKYPSKKQSQNSNETSEEVRGRKKSVLKNPGAPRVKGRRKPKNAGEAKGKKAKEDEAEFRSVGSSASKEPGGARKNSPPEERGEEKGKTRVLTRVGAAISEYEHVYQRGGLRSVGHVERACVLALRRASHSPSAASLLLRTLSHSRVPLHPFVRPLSRRARPYQFVSVRCTAPHRCSSSSFACSLAFPSFLPSFLLADPPRLSSSASHAAVSIRLCPVHHRAPTFLLLVRLAGTERSSFAVPPLSSWSFPPMDTLLDPLGRTKARQYLDQACFSPREVSWAAFARANQKAS